MVTKYFIFSFSSYISKDFLTENIRNFYKSIFAEKNFLDNNSDSQGREI